jgi:hypothetical protein
MTLRGRLGEGRDHWLAELPVLVARIAVEWRIEVGTPFLPGGMTAWVAPARDDAAAPPVRIRSACTARPPSALIVVSAHRRRPLMSDSHSHTAAP